MPDPLYLFYGIKKPKRNRCFQVTLTNITASVGTACPTPSKYTELVDDRAKPELRSRGAPPQRDYRNSVWFSWRTHNSINCVNYLQLSGKDMYLTLVHILLNILRVRENVFPQVRHVLPRLFLVNIIHWFSVFLEIFLTTRC